MGEDYGCKNEKKICFIICTNSQLFLEECIFYLRHLNVPSGYEVDIVTIHDAKSMTSGYNEGMHATDAKYKIYMHQDVFILNRNFIQDILDIFNANPLIGMIGLVGAEKMPENGIMWATTRYGNLYGMDAVEEEQGVDYQRYQYSLENDAFHVVEVIDGLLMATAYDIPWREDIFDGWDFYDASQSMEFRRRGYYIVTPVQKEPWCVHDDGHVLSMWNYDKYRKKFLKEYGNQ